MEMGYSLRALRQANGKSPVATWYKSIKDKTTRAVIAARLTRIQGGNLGTYRVLGGGVSEIKIGFGPSYRVYFAQAGHTIIVLLAGGDKSTQADDIKAAQAL